MQADVAQAETDPSRPAYHFRPPAGYHNDPNGLICHAGFYHLFYQFHPFTGGRGKGDRIFWGHARSSDLVHWEPLPLAIWPSIEAGELRCASGSTIVGPEGTPLIFYTSLGDRASQAAAPDQWAAVGDPDLVAWDKHRDNPVLTARVHGGLRISQWRDPFVFREGGDWYMLIGGRVHRPERERGCIAIYRAADGGLMDWRFAGILYEWPDAEVTSIECPNLFRLGDRWLLLFSYHPPATQVAWLSGWFDPVACTFSSQRQGRIDLSPMGTYAHQGMRDERGRVILFGWVRGAGWYPGGGRGWSGCMSLPQVVSLDAAGCLVRRPAEELTELRGRHHNQQPVLLRDEVRSVAGISGDRLEIVAELRPREEAACGLVVRRSSGGERGVVIRFAAGRLQVTGADPAGIFTGGNGSSAGGDFDVPFDPGGEEMVLQLRLFLDGCVLELFVNERASLTRAIYAAPGDLGVAAFAEGEVEVERLEAWEMMGVW